MEAAEIAHVLNLRLKQRDIANAMVNALKADGAVGGLGIHRGVASKIWVGAGAGDEAEGNVAIEADFGDGVGVGGGGKRCWLEQRFGAIGDSSEEGRGGTVDGDGDGANGKAVELDKAEGSVGVEVGDGAGRRVKGGFVRRCEREYHVARAESVGARGRGAGGGV